MQESKMETRVNVPLRTGGKKMRKRKELDALNRRGQSNKRSTPGGVSSQDQLLSESTDEQDEFWTTTKGRNESVSRRSHFLEKRRTCTSLLRVCTLMLVFACVVATTTVMWLFIDVREQATFLRNQLDQVVAGSQSVPDALQKCHSLSKELQQNQTSLFLQVTNLAARLANFSIQVTGISNGLSKVEERFKTSPELINVPQEVQTLKTNIATFGSQIEDLITTVSQLKESNTHLAETAQVLQSNVTTLKQNLSEISVPVRVSSPSPSSEDIQAVNATLDSVRDSLSKINSTLSEKLQWAVEDQSKDHKSIVALQESSENVSARVTTLQNECQAKSVQLTTLTSNVEHLSSQGSINEKRWSELIGQVNDLSNKYSLLQANTTDLHNVIEGIKKNVSSSNSSLTGPSLNSQPDETNNSSTSR